jgi:superfamily II DNA or RNA helicase
VAALKLLAGPLPAVVYSQFVGEGGLGSFRRYLHAAGWRRWTGAEDEGRYYAVISGDVPFQERVRVIEHFNVPANNRGARIGALLVSSSGAEGINLKCVRQVLLMEPYWDKSLEEQVIARGLRLGSHDTLPPDERELQPTLFLATANRETLARIPADEKVEDETVDERFHRRALGRQRLFDELKEVFRAVSVEAVAFGYPGARVCAPTGERLCHGDLHLDLRLPDPCRAPKKTEVDAAPFEHDGETYYRDADGRFYQKNARLGAFTEVPPGSRLGVRLAEAHGAL